MLAIQGLRPVTRILILAREGGERGTGRRLAAIQVPDGFPLSIVTVYGRVLILEVQQDASPRPRRAALRSAVRRAAASWARDSGAPWKASIVTMVFSW